MALKFEINADEILSQFSEFKDEIKKNLEDSLRNLVSLTRARIVEQTDVLSSATNRIYMESLQDEQEVAPNVWVIALDEKAFWIEEGIEAGHDMKPDLLKGKKLRAIPFRYDRPESRNTPTTQGLIGEIKQKLKKENLSISKIEKNASGSPRVGKLHEFNFGGPIPGRGNTPALQRLTIYQSQNKEGKVRRDVLTFRSVSSGPASEGKWIHPGYEAKHFMDKAMDKAVKDWEEQILPEILEKWSSK
jgi:hypothetical protein